MTVSVSRVPDLRPRLRLRFSFGRIVTWPYRGPFPSRHSSSVARTSRTISIERRKTKIDFLRRVVTSSWFLARANEQSVHDADTLQSFSSFSFSPSPTTKDDKTSSSVKHRVYVRARTDDSRFHRVPRTFYGTLLRESSGNRRACSRSITQTTRGGRTVRGSNLTLLTRYPVLPIAIDAISRSGSRITGKKHHIGQERNEHT